MARSKSRGRRKSRSRSRRGGGGRRRSPSRRRRSPSRGRKPRRSASRKRDASKEESKVDSTVFNEGVFASMLAIKGPGGGPPPERQPMLSALLPSFMQPSFMQPSFGSSSPPGLDPGLVVQGNLAALGFTVQLPGQPKQPPPQPPPQPVEQAPPPPPPVEMPPLPVPVPQAPAPAPTTLSSLMNSMPFQPPSKVGGMKICVSYMSIGRCSRQQTCPLKHQMDEREFAHWKEYFGRTACRDGLNCSCLPQCVYMHPPEHRALKQARLMEQGFSTQRQAALALGNVPAGHGSQWQPPPPPPDGLPPGMAPPPPLGYPAPPAGLPQPSDAPFPPSLQDAAEKELYASMAAANVL